MVMSLIVSLIRFLIVTFVIPARTLPSLKLSLKPYNYNFDGSTRNPIIYNNPGKFTCQPGKCIYPYNIVPDTSTGKTSYSCGASVEIEVDAPCGISQSNLFGERLRSSREGAYSIGETLTDVSEVSFIGVFNYLLVCLSILTILRDLLLVLCSLPDYCIKSQRKKTNYLFMEHLTSRMII